MITIAQNTVTHRLGMPRPCACCDSAPLLPVCTHTGVWSHKGCTRRLHTRCARRAAAYGRSSWRPREARWAALRLRLRIPLTRMRCARARLRSRGSEQRWAHCAAYKLRWEGGLGDKRGLGVHTVP